MYQVTSGQRLEEHTSVSFHLFMVQINTATKKNKSKSSPEAEAVEEVKECSWLQFPVEVDSNSDLHNFTETSIPTWELMYLCPHVQTKIFDDGIKAAVFTGSSRFSDSV